LKRRRHRDVVALQFAPHVRLGPVHVRAAELDFAVEGLACVGPAAHPIARFQKEYRVALLGEVPRRDDPGERGTDHHDVITAGRGRVRSARRHRRLAASRSAAAIPA
jgi:hypothetical protein